MIRPLAISLSPNLENKDVFLAIKQLFSPWNYFKDDGVRSLEQWFRQYYKSSYAVSFYSGRSAMLAILKAMDIKKGDEVLLQPFTCVAVPNAIIWAGATPVYVDITTQLTIDPLLIEEKITTKTKAILVQHTFGIPADMVKIQALANKHKLFIIEDCAHAIAASYKGKKLGTFGDAAFFSFGRDKAVSSVWGGMALIKSDVLGKKLREIQKRLPKKSFAWILQQLLHPVAFWFILLTYDILFIGKIVLVILQKIHFLSFPVSVNDKKSKMEKEPLAKMPNQLATLAYFQLKRIQEFNKKRESSAKMYIESIKNIALPYTEPTPFLRFPIFMEKRDEFLRMLRKKQIYLGKWYGDIIDPKGTDLKKIYYLRGMCPNAEIAARSIVNLPCYPTLSAKDVKKIVKLVNAYVA